MPSGGLLSQVRLSHVFNGPDVLIDEQTFDFDSSLTQLSAVANRLLEPRSEQSSVRVRRLRHVVR